MKFTVRMGLKMCCCFELILVFLILGPIVSGTTSKNVETANEADNSTLLEFEGLLEKEENFTFGFSGTLSEASTTKHNHVVVCTVYSHTMMELSQNLSKGTFPMTFSLDSVPRNLCTHILYHDPFLKWWPTSGYSSNFEPKKEGDYYELREKLTRLKRKPGKTAILLQIRDIEHNTTEVSQVKLELNRIARRKAYRENFVNDTITYLRRNNLDGLDIQLQILNLLHRNKLLNTKTYAEYVPLLMFELREAFKPLKYQLTYSFVKTTWNLLPQLRNLKRMGIHRVVSIVDQVHLSGGDSFSDIGLKDPSRRADYLPLTAGLRDTLKYFIEDFKVAPSKIVIGFALKGMVVHIGSSALNFQPDKSYMLRLNTLSNNKICEAFRTAPLNWTVYYSQCSQLYFMQNASARIWFESAKSITMKIQEGLEKQVKGFMLNDIYYDDFEGRLCDNHGTTFPVLRTINSVLANAAANPSKLLISNGLNNWTKCPVPLSNPGIIPIPTHDKVVKCDINPYQNIWIQNFKRNQQLYRITPSDINTFHKMYPMCTHFSVATIDGVDLSTLLINVTDLNKQLEAELEVEPIGFIKTNKVQHFHEFFPHLKLTLSLWLFNPSEVRDLRSLIPKIAYPAKNRRKFIKGISTTLQEFGLNGIELSIIPDGFPVSRRMMSLLTVLFYDLHKELSTLHQILGLNVEHDSAPRNFLYDRYLLKQVDYINVIPHSGNMEAVPPNLGNQAWQADKVMLQDDLDGEVQAAVNYLGSIGVLPSKIIVGTLNYAIRYSITGNHFKFVTRWQACFLRKKDPKQWKHVHRQGTDYITNGIEIYEHPTERTIKNLIQEAIKAGVGGFMVNDLAYDFYFEIWCSFEGKFPYGTLNLIHNVLTRQPNSSTQEPKI